MALDTGVLLLLLYGRCHPSGLGRFRRVEQFAPEDYDLLKRLLGQFPRVATTPSVVTEAANLVDDATGAVRELLLLELKAFCRTARESYFQSARITTEQPYVRLEITDTSLLLLGRRGYGVVTTDSRLWSEAVALGYPCLNFNTIRFIS